MTKEQKEAIRDYVAAHEDKRYEVLAVELNISRQTLITALKGTGYKRPRGRKLRLIIPESKQKK